MNRYDESVYAARWMLVVIALAMFATLGAAIATLFSGDSRQWGVAGMLVGIGAILGLAELMFMRLQIEVDQERLRFRFGPFGPTLKLSEIQSAEADPYRWLVFGGWGIRFGRVSGRFMRAYSVPFMRTGVAIETVTGARYYISSRQPEALATAILKGRAQEGRA